MSMEERELMVHVYALPAKRGIPSNFGHARRNTAVKSIHVVGYMPAW